MKTLKRIDITYEKVHYMPRHADMKENVIYISDDYGTSSHRCICGCGELTVTPLGKGEWNYQIDINDKLHMQPSVGNFQLPCKSHYIITKGGANFV